MKAKPASIAALLLLVLVYAAFISLGLPDSSLGLAWPAMRTTWHQPLAALGILTIITTVASALSGLASGWVLKRLGTGPVVLISCVLTGLAFLGFSLAPSFQWLFLLALPLGFGAGSVDAGLNHFVAEHYSARHMNWLHGFWGIGATLGPILMAAAIAGPGWAAGYRRIALIQLSLAAVFLISLPLWRREDALPAARPEEEAQRPLPGSRPAWTAWLGPALYLAYAAVETGTGLWAASVLVDGRRFPPALAGLAMSFFYGSIMCGRFLTGVIASRLGNRSLVRFGTCLALCGGVLFALAGFLSGLPVLSILGLALLGLGCAPIYPCLMHETPRRYDRETARVVVGRQVAFAYIGGALVPPAFGLLAAAAGLEAVMPAVIVAGALLLGLTELLNSRT